MHYYLLMWRRVFKFSGRATRAEYWWAMLINIALGFGVPMLLYQSLMYLLRNDFFQPRHLDILMNVVTCVFISFFIIFIPTTFSLQVRRFHDIGLSGKLWLLLILLSVLVTVMLNLFYEGADWLDIAHKVNGWVLYLVLMGLSLKDSQPFENKYGPDPKGGADFS